MKSVLPLYCHLCLQKLKNEDDFLCKSCEDSIKEHIKFHFLKRIELLVEWENLYSYMDYHIVKKNWDLLAEIKFQNKKKFLFFLLSNIDFSNLPQVDFITYIPISFKRFVERGFNPSKVIAQKIATDLKIPCVKLLKKKDNKKQASKTREERLGVMHQNPFKRNKISRNVLKKGHILIVDDIITTGATITAAAISIKEKYSYKVSGISLFYSDIE